MAIEQLTYVQAISIGVLQGVTELFPVSSLGHSVLIPAWIGGSWAALVTQESSSESPYLAFLVGLHVATALALLWYFRAEWARIARGFVRSLRARRITDTDAKIAWLVILATIPVGLIGLLAEHTLRTVFAKPVYASVFLALNGLILLAGERYRRREEKRAASAAAPASAFAGRGGAAGDPGAPETGSDGSGPLTEGGPDEIASEIPRRTNEQGRAVGTLRPVEALGLGVAQSAALLAGISRSGVTIVAGLVRGLTHEDAARFAFLLATPVILLAGVYKLPDLLGPNGDGVRGQILVGSLAAGVAAYLSVRFLDRWFQTRTLKPFAIYCLTAGVVSLLYFA